MGCKISKNENDIEISDNVQPEILATMNEKVDYKSRLEWKMCLARDTPEPDFDLSHCNLSDVPSGVFVLCRVLLKENLLLQNNKLRWLRNGGELSELKRLTSINLSNNKFTNLPIDFWFLENLRDLFLSQNEISSLPSEIKKLKNLELLDLSNNELTNIDQIACMPKLKILILNGNNRISQLPSQLTTCDGLIDISLDADNFIEPPSDIINLGTLEILRYLSTGKKITKLLQVKTEEIKSVTSSFIENEKGLNTYEQNIYTDNNMRRALEAKFLEHERGQFEKYSQIDTLMHERNHQLKQEFLKNLLHQQNQTDELLRNIQKVKDVERNELIEEISKKEHNAGIIVDKLLSLKKGPDADLMEYERIQRNRLLEKLQVDNMQLRKKDILNVMSDVIEAEARQIQEYHEKKAANVKLLIEQENDLDIENILKSNDRSRQMTLVAENEDWQKAVVGSFIEQNDARALGLIEQVRIVESQLASMTRCEIDRKKCELDGRVNALGQKRLELTYMLMDLLDQQKQRKLELLDVLSMMEAQKDDEQRDFWLLQYQRLIDSKPSDVNFKASSIDPALSQYLLVNGVIHCIPFLSKLWKVNFNDISMLIDNDLLEAGIRNPIDRQNIILSIKQFNDNKMKKRLLSAPTEDTEEAILISSENSPKDQTIESNSECVVCMEFESKIIFLPCGHLCCCDRCEKSIQMCPMCRALIDQRIKVIRA